MSTSYYIAYNDCISAAQSPQYITLMETIVNTHVLIVQQFKLDSGDMISTQTKSEVIGLSSKETDDHERGTDWYFPNECSYIGQPFLNFILLSCELREGTPFFLVFCREYL